MTNFEKITASPDVLGEFLASLPVATGPWDEEFHRDSPCPDWKKYFKVDPPEGEGWQLWGTTSEGEPRSPVFKTPEELADWCAENDTVFADIKRSKDARLPNISELFRLPRSWCWPPETRGYSVGGKPAWMGLLIS